MFTMARDGSDVRALTDSVGISGDPAWSPDGKLIAFEADRGSQADQGIYVANASDGSGLRRITTLPTGFGIDKAPRFSPDGKQILFNRWKNDTEGALYVVNLDQWRTRLIYLGDVSTGDATWSPDGSEIAVEGDMTFERYTGPWVVGSDGQDARSLTDKQPTTGTWELADPVWSPDGTLIMLLEGIHEQDGTLVTSGLATIHPDGTGLTYVTDGMGAEHRPELEHVQLRCLKPGRCRRWGIGIGLRP